MLFTVSHEKNGVYQALLVDARSQEIAEAYFKEMEPENRFIGIHEAKSEDFKPGKPVLMVPATFSLEFIQGRMRAFNEKMRELEAQGFRSGGWDEKTDKTAIIKVGKTWNDNRIVGYMDRDLNIEWETKVLSVARADEHYLEGSVFVAGEVYPFDYNVETEAIEVHCYSEPGWMTGASYEKPLPEAVNENIEEVVSVIQSAVDDFLKNSDKDLDTVIENAKAASREGVLSSDVKEQEYGLD